MSAPDLPEIFGNYVLGDDFNEVVSPDAVNWWPQTPGWYVVGAVLVFFLLRYSWRRLRYWYRNRYRKEARNRLQNLSQTGNAAAAINQVLKLSALAAFDRTDVASLSGQQWANFLNSRCTEPVFEPAQCQLLAEAVYIQGQLDEEQHRALVQSSLRWLDTHRNRFGD